MSSQTSIKGKRPLFESNAKIHLSKLIECASRGEEIIVTRGGRSVARLTAIEPVEHGRRSGAMDREATVDDRFFEPLPDEELTASE